MDTTRQSLLLLAQAGDAGAGPDLCAPDRPLIVGWLRRQSIPQADTDDLVQEIFLAVVGSLPSFIHSGRPWGVPLLAADDRPELLVRLPGVAGAVVGSAPG